LGNDGIKIKFGHTPPTPNFQRHINKYFLSFCQDAIVSFLAVGFVPYRIRLNEKGAKIPEVLPLGTFTWHVGRGNKSQYATPWESIGKSPTSENETNKSKTLDNRPILQYIVNSAYCDEEIFVYDFVKPQILFSCTSPFSALVQPYMFLCHRRECLLKADAFNCQPSMVFEHQEKVLINDVNETGLIIQNTKDMNGRNNTEYRNIGERQILMQNLVEESKGLSRLPQESITVVAPKNHSVHGLDKVVSPVEIQKDEINFYRMVAMACGLPLNMIIQGGDSTISTQHWAQNSEVSNRMLLDTCHDINIHLETLLGDVYSKIYGSDSKPSFVFQSLPIIPLEQFIQAHEMQLVDEQSLSSILKSTWGFPLSAEAKELRLLKRKAEFVLPFQDRMATNKKDQH
jgi:hypothetical protein